MESEVESGRVSVLEDVRHRLTHDEAKMVPCRRGQDQVGDVVVVIDVNPQVKTAAAGHCFHVVGHERAEPTQCVVGWIHRPDDLVDGSGEALSGAVDLIELLIERHGLRRGRLRCGPPHQIARHGDLREPGPEAVVDVPCDPRPVPLPLLLLLEQRDPAAVRQPARPPCDGSSKPCHAAE